LPVPGSWPVNVHAILDLPAIGRQYTVIKKTFLSKMNGTGIKLASRKDGYTFFRRRFLLTMEVIGPANVSVQ
jgi:hypothetical protein